MNWLRSLKNSFCHRWFQRCATGVLCIFFGIMILVTIIAYSKHSGSTGMDMAQVQKLRFEAHGPQGPESFKE